MKEEEELLGVFIEMGITSSELLRGESMSTGDDGDGHVGSSMGMTTHPGPVEGGVHQLQLLLHTGDVVTRPLGRVDASFDGGVLGRQTKGIPAHGKQDTSSSEPVVACDDIGDGVDAEVSQVKLPRGIWKHGQDIHVIIGSFRAGGLAPSTLAPSLTPCSIQGREVELCRSVASREGDG